MRERLLGDIVAFTALPAVWVGQPPERIAEALATALDRTLPLQGVAVILRSETGIVRSRHGESETLVSDIEAWLEGRPLDPATLQIEIGPLGTRGTILLRGEEMRDERLLVARLAANLADNALREAMLHRQAALARDRALRLEKVFALAQLVSGVAHELRTPLTYANNSIYLAQRRLAKARGLHPEDRAQLDEHLRDIVGAHERVEGTVNTLRRLSAPRPGRKERFVLSDAVFEAARLFADTHVGRVEVIRDLQASGELEGARAEIQQVVLNLLQNAAEAMPRGGRVLVRTTDGAGTVALVVEDEGPGIPIEVRDRLFDAFFTTKEEGTGLGLSIVRKITDAHGGTILVEDGGKGGARFVVEFPRAARPVVLSEGAAEQRARRPATPS